MRALELETWVTRILDAAAAGHPSEDFRIEFKREWPDPVRAARRLAGHANAALGDQILWLVGVDDSGIVVGSVNNERATWWPKVEGCFDEAPPRLVKDMNIAHGSHTVVALLFDTERAPFVVNAPPPGGTIQREIPWREGTQIRTARRQDIIRMVAPIVGLPTIDLVGGELVTIRNDMGDDSLHLSATLFVTPANRVLHVASTRFRAELAIPGREAALTLDEGADLRTADDHVDVEPTTAGALSFTAPGPMGVEAGAVVPRASIPDEPIALTLRIGVIGQARDVEIRAELRPIGEKPASNVPQQWIPVL
jgi:hypothetical protein